MEVFLEFGDCYGYFALLRIEDIDQNSLSEEETGKAFKKFHLFSNDASS